MTSAAGFPAKLRDTLRRINPLPDSARPLFRPSPAELVLWLVLAAVTLVMVCYHEPWRDEAQGYLVARDNSGSKAPGARMHALHVEGQVIFERSLLERDPEPRHGKGGNRTECKQTSNKANIHLE